MPDNHTRLPLRGEDHAKAFLKESDIHDIDRMWAQGHRQQVIADLLGISQPHVALILKRTIWSHVPILTPPPNQKQEWTEIREAIRADWISDPAWSQTTLAKAYGVTQSYVCKVVKGLPIHNK